MHDKILFMANTGIRPDEANLLEDRDVEIVEDEASGQTILEIEVHGTRDEEGASFGRGKDIGQYLNSRN